MGACPWRVTNERGINADLTSWLHGCTRLHCVFFPPSIFLLIVLYEPYFTNRTLVYQFWCKILISFYYFSTKIDSNLEHSFYTVSRGEPLREIHPLGKQIAHTFIYPLLLPLYVIPQSIFFVKKISFTKWIFIRTWYSHIYAICHSWFRDSWLWLAVVEKCRVWSDKSPVKEMTDDVSLFILPEKEPKKINPSTWNYSLRAHTFCI